MKNFLTELSQSGVTIKLENGRLKITPKQKPDALEKIGVRKLEIIAYLENRGKEAISGTQNEPSLCSDVPRLQAEDPFGEELIEHIQRVVSEASRVASRAGEGSNIWNQIWDLTNELDDACDKRDPVAIANLLSKIEIFLH